MFSAGTDYQIRFFDRHYKKNDQKILSLTITNFKDDKVFAYTDLSEHQSVYGKLEYQCEKTGIYKLTFKLGEYTCGGALLGYKRDKSPIKQHWEVKITLPQSIEKPKGQARSWSFDSSEDDKGKLHFQIRVREEDLNFSVKTRGNSPEAVIEKIKHLLFEKYGINFEVRAQTI